MAKPKAKKRARSPPPSGGATAATDAPVREGTTRGGGGGRGEGGGGGHGGGSVAPAKKKSKGAARRDAPDAAAPATTTLSALPNASPSATRWRDLPSSALAEIVAERVGARYRHAKRAGLVAMLESHVRAERHCADELVKTADGVLNVFRDVPPGPPFEVGEREMMVEKMRALREVAVAHAAAREADVFARGAHGFASSTSSPAPRESTGPGPSPPRAAAAADDEKRGKPGKQHARRGDRDPGGRGGGYSDERLRRTKLNAPLVGASLPVLALFLRPCVCEVRSVLTLVPPV